VDKDTRNAIERATQRARKLLEEDFAAQLEGDFDVHQNGEVAARAGKHLSPRQAFSRERIVAAIEHKRAAGMSGADAARDYLRDAAFTTLNRFVALKMLEARELVQVCITKGEHSVGYREFCGMAPGLPLLSESAGYRLYIESLFDELSTEVKVLFDRRDPSSVLWPKRATFEQLLEVLNATELAGVWVEDETIGWVYQFFNSKDERAAMRDVKQGGSQAPRNSRELAVRNQFFTPRYVVQFLTDNTLGRIWYEMLGTKTVLVEKCAYMVRRPNELPLLEHGAREEPWLSEVAAGKWSAIPEDFSWDRSCGFAQLINGYEVALALGLAGAGEFANERHRAAEQSGTWEGTALELWICLFFEHRRYRHFGRGPEGRGLVLLNALCQQLRAALVEEEQAGRAPRFFTKRAKKDPRDLRVLDPACGSGHFLLYAFDLLLAIYEEAHSDAESPKSEATGKTLAADYPSVDALRRAVPGLVLAHNLHGVDIDPRCAQIAQLALWMRAQKAYREFGIGRAERPQIRRSKIVVAEPLVADDQIAKEFVAKLGGAELGRLFTTLVESLNLAGDLGLLLRVEQFVARQSKRGQTGNLFAPPEERIRTALDRFVREEASATNTRRRLFVDDAAHGVALLGVAEKKFDVVLMNPPFGEGSTRAKKYFEAAYPAAKAEVYAAFVVRGIELLTQRGRLGAITSRTGFFLSTFQSWREEAVLANAPPTVFADLGAGVLDSAMVETAAYCLEARP
jgi:hypothetical protein